MQGKRNGRLQHTDNLIRHVCILIICLLRYPRFFNLKITFYTKLEIYSVFKFKFQKLVLNLHKNYFYWSDDLSLFFF